MLTSEKKMTYSERSRIYASEAIAFMEGRFVCHLLSTIGMWGNGNVDDPAASLVASCMQLMYVAYVGQSSLNTSLILSILEQIPDGDICFLVFGDGDGSVAC